MQDRARLRKGCQRPPTPQRPAPEPITNNAGHIVDCGERFRSGEQIFTGFVESAVNQVIDKRFDKRQSMRWTPRGAHLLLQTRTRVLDGDLDDLIRCHYPAFRMPSVAEPAPGL